MLKDPGPATGQWVSGSGRRLRLCHANRGLVSRGLIAVFPGYTSTVDNGVLIIMPMENDYISGTLLGNETIIHQLLSTGRHSVHQRDTRLR